MKYVFVVLLSLFAVSTYGAAIYWHASGQGSDPTEWSDAANWKYSQLPGAGDYAIIDEYSSIWPVIRSDVQDCDHVCLSWNPYKTTEMYVDTGGSIYVADHNANGSTFLRIGNNDESVGTLWIRGGYLTAHHLELAWHATSVARVHILAGQIHCNDLTFGPGDGKINIEQGLFVINGDHTETGSGKVPAWIAQGKLVGYDGTRPLKYSYRSENSYTVVSSEPLQPTVLNTLWRVVVNGQDRMTTGSAGERDQFSSEGAVFYVPQDAQSGTVPLYRHIHPGTGDHKDSLLISEPGYNLEGAVGYPWTDALPGTSEVMRDHEGDDYALVHSGESVYGNEEGLGVYGYRRYNNELEDVLSLSAGGVTIQSNQVAGGVLWEWTWNGKQFVNDADFGRQIQCALFVAGQNPTEAGSEHTYYSDNQRRQGSPYSRCENVGHTQITECVPLEWDPDSFGGDVDHPVVYEGVRLGKEITLDWKQMGPVAKYVTTLELAEPLYSAAFEIPTAYLTGEFDRYWTYDAKGEVLTEVTPPHCTFLPYQYATDFGGVILSNSTNTHALGVYGRSMAKGGDVLYYTLWDFTCLSAGTGQFDGACTKWNAVYQGPMEAGRNEYVTWLVSGTLTDVTATMRQLYERLRADVNNDGETDLGDLAVMMGAWVDEGSDLAADLTEDGRVDLEDFFLLAERWQN